MTFRLLALAPLCAALLWSAPSLGAEERDDYTGKWVLDLKASDVGDTPPVFREMTLELENNAMRVKRREVRKDGEVRKTDYTYVCDGKPQEISMPDDETRSATVRWKGNDLDIESNMMRMGQPIEATAQWQLKSKNVLEIRSDVTSAFFSGTFKEVFRRKGTK